MRGIGDTAEVALTCQFGVITPGISRVLGSSVAVSASSVFPVKAGMTATGGGGGGGGSAPNAAFTGNGTVSPNSLTGIKPFTVVFRDTSGGGPTSWAWDFDGDGTTDSTLQDPLDHIFASTGTFIVRMTATNAKGSSTASMGVTVVDSGTVDFTADQTSGNAPLAVQFTSTSAAGGTAYAWTFGAGEGSGTGATASHTYSTAGTYTVSLTVTYANGNLTQTKTNYITVNPKLCTVPSFNGVKRNGASAVWTGAGFTAANLSSGPGAPGGNGWTITTQTITASSIVACNATIQVNDH
jgi:PKD repeat protein